MPRKTDNAPIKNTCPQIDKVIYFLEKIEWDLLDDDEKELSFECLEIVQIMEEIRNANDTLRTWGNEEYQNKIEFEIEIYDLEKEVKNLKYDISDLQDDIQSLKKDNETLEEKLASVEC
jgi:predicted RNase H-like nuclease (RuvC/YqgF family)